ncbi:glucose-1-phosphate thymidylyltransferase RfbA [uncultured Cetobacterium sp.]|uniref:glucose-1-phosphate thymidylyltransferase RfbA n=1 Tax=uncultured Cetobacterium sp. TaxID=527638 RepID=UPI0026329F1D|nr:glucose-1-phosphate thymidylyltransferase RfbA [uncultured Cetobacterium sp.]
MRGIILAGGVGSRLYPVTKGINKHLIPVYDKPLIYYPLSVLMLAEIKDILIITNKDDKNIFENLLGNGRDLGLRIEYAIQKNPNGLSEAFIIGEDFIGNDSCALVLGDNLFYGHGFTGIIKNAVKMKKGAVIFGYYVNNPKSFGVVEFNEDGKAISLEEKPENPKSNYAIPGLYFYDNTVIEKAKKVKPSKRGELEITTLNEMYLKEGSLNVLSLGRGMAWLDTGTHDGLLEASNFVKTIQSRQGIMIACLEEIAYNNGWINENKLIYLGKKLEKTNYGKYILSLKKANQ